MGGVRPEARLHAMRPQKSYETAPLGVCLRRTPWSIDTWQKSEAVGVGESSKWVLIILIN